MKAILIAGAALALALSLGVTAQAQRGAPLVPGAGIRSYPNQPLRYSQSDRGRWDFDDRWRDRRDWDRGSYGWDFDDRWRDRGDRYRAYRPDYGRSWSAPGYGSYRIYPGPGFGYYIRPYGSSYLYPYGGRYY